MALRRRPTRQAQFALYPTAGSQQDRFGDLEPDDKPEPYDESEPDDEPGTEDEHPETEGEAANPALFHHPPPLPATIRRGCPPASSASTACASSELCRRRRSVPLPPMPPPSDSPGFANLTAAVKAGHAWQGRLDRRAERLISA